MSVALNFERAVTAGFDISNAVFLVLNTAFARKQNAAPASAIFISKVQVVIRQQEPAKVAAGLAISCRRHRCYFSPSGQRGRPGGDAVDYARRGRDFFRADQPAGLRVNTLSATGRHQASADALGRVAAAIP